ncbi:MAG: triose-phosphate isomerase [Deltaproteobacteria bacterium]|nr:triose-phosphate isomerase [Deltaproteobacteria bacterium]MBW2414568.1 triose-phosphate isomerase [Deltaproteobacteria bacterium]
MRTPIIAANWKMQKTTGEAAAFAEGLAEHLGDSPVEVVVAPPFTALGAFASALSAAGLDGRVSIAGQNVHAEPAGAFTGEVSVPMLVDVGCRYVILGHSERRALFGESSGVVADKLRAAQSGGLRAIVCIGETLQEREDERTFEVLAAQLDESLASADSRRWPELVIAYEPVWAIGTGRTASPEEAQAAHAFVRERLSGLAGAASTEIRIQYGGSVKPENAADLLARPDIDGALVGGASLDPKSFSAIIHSGSPGDSRAAE